MKSVQEISPEKNDDESEQVYNVNLFRLTQDGQNGKDRDDDFKVQLVINNKLDTVLADTGAKISVCSKKQEEKWGILERVTPTRDRIKPYKSPVIPTIGEARCSVSFGARSIPVKWHIIEESCQPVLAGGHAKQLGIISFQRMPETLMPVNPIELDSKEVMQDILCQYPGCFDKIGKLRDYQVELHVVVNLFYLVHKNK